MCGKTVGIIGTGKIGKCTCEILFGFGCNILAHDVIEDRDLVQRKSTNQIIPSFHFKSLDIFCSSQSPFF
jgi:lactate dehydrogenase-like 2-hydroxyacid dehydrogenase